MRTFLRQHRTAIVATLETMVVVGMIIGVLWSSTPLAWALGGVAILIVLGRLA